MIISKRFEAVIFDMDGLLIDTERIFRVAVVETVEAMGFVLPEDVQQAMIGLPDTDIVMQEFFGPEFSIADFRHRLHEQVDARLAGGIPLRAGVLEILDFLDQRDIPKAVATSTRRPTTEKHLSRCGIRHRFQAVATRDDVARGKPHPDVYLRAAADLGFAPAKCVALEDSHNGVRAAHAAGIATIMVPDLLRPTAEMSALCIAVVDDLHQVRRLFGD